jgi:hypothetical protein
MFNIYGQEVVKTIFNQMENSIDISRMAEGSYSLVTRKGNNATCNRVTLLKN